MRSQTAIFRFSVVRVWKAKVVKNKGFFFNISSIPKSETILGNCYFTKHITSLQRFIGGRNERKFI